MKKGKNLLRFGYMLFLATLFVSCAKMGEMSSEYITVVPSPLEVKANKVEATITGKFPEKYFLKKATLDVTPVLKYEGGEAVGTTVTYQGEKVKGNNTVIAYKAGGTFTQTISFDYVPAMKTSKLYLTFKAKVGKKEVQIPEVEIAQGCITTSTLVNPKEVATAIGADKFERIIKENYEAAILFEIQRADLKSKALKTEDIKKLAAQLASANDKKAVSALEVAAYASPDGGVSLNEKLAANREKNTVDYLSKELKKSKITTPVDAKYTAQDWEGFQQLMMNSNIQDKDLILRVLSMYSDPDQREKEIKNLSAAYTKIASEILPQLRRSKMKLVMDVVGKSDEEILAAAKQNPSSLTIEELIYAGKIAQDKSLKTASAEQVVALYPEDWRGYNNLAALKIEAGQTAEASKLLATAAQKGGDQPQINYNLGLVELTKNNYTKAKEYFGKAAGVGESLAEAQGVAYIQAGQYDKAVSAFGNTTSNNAALAQILNGNYQKATAIADACQNKTADTYYLKAIAGARSNNKDQVISSLKSAIQKDSSYAKKAASDMEFAKYLVDADFLSVAK